MNIEPKYHTVDTDYNIREYINYMNDVLNGTIIANEYIRLACQRMYDWFSRDDIYFDVDDVDSRINFIWKLKHTTGHHYGHHFKLLAWQQFIVANAYGWKWKDSGLRVTRNVFIMISRKNGKTALAAALALCNIICDKEHDAEIDLVANNSRQAGIAFNHIHNFVASVDPKQLVFKRFRSEIRVPMLKSKIQVLSSDSMGLDGYSSSVVIFDELHAQKNWDLYNVMKSSQGARQQPLMITLTTAGFLVGNCYPCYSMWETCIDILRGEKTDDTTFSAIYQLDPNDDWKDESVWTKCSPSLDQTVFRSFMRDEMNSAINNSSLETGVKTKTFNIWCQAESVWLPYELLRDNMQPLSVDDLASLPNVSYAYIGVDLSAVSDLTALSLMVESDGTFYFKNWAFVPEDCLQGGVNAGRYREWANSKYIDITPGNVQDYDYILNKIIEIDKKIPIANIAYDTWNAIQFAVNATNLGLPMLPYSQALGNFNRPTKQYELLLKSGRVVMDYNPAVLWCFASSTLKQDFNGNCKPIKTDQHNSKIDMVIAMLESLGGYYLDNAPDVELTAI